MRLFAFICARRTEIYPIYAVLAGDRCRLAAFIMPVFAVLAVLLMALASIVRTTARRINAGFVARRNAVAVIIFAHCCQSFFGYCRYTAREMCARFGCNIIFGRTVVCAYLGYSITPKKHVLAP